MNVKHIIQMSLLTVALSNVVLATEASIATTPAQSTIEPLVLPPELKPEPVKASDDEMKKFVAMLKNVMKSPEGLEIMQYVQMRAAFAEEESNQKLMKLLVDNKAALMNEKDAIIWGNPQGVVKLVLFTDPLCPNCRVLSDMLQRLVAKNKDVRVIVHQWAFVNPDESSIVSRYLYAAYQQDPKKYVNLLGAVLNLKEAPTAARVEGLLAGAKLDAAKIKEAASEKAATDRIESVRELAKKLEFPGAPIFMIEAPDGNLQLIPPLSEDILFASIDEATKAIKSKK